MKTKHVKQRPGTQGLTDVQNLFFFSANSCQSLEFMKAKKSLDSLCMPSGIVYGKKIENSDPAASKAWHLKEIIFTI